LTTKKIRQRIPLQPHQRAIANSPAKRIVVCAGRRGGKTYLAAAKAVQAASVGRRVLYATPVNDQATAFWERACAMTAAAVSYRQVTRHEMTRSLEFAGGGRIRCKTAHDPDTMRGDYADFLILDEYAYMKPEAWEQVGAPMLLDNNGDAWFISTPTPLNHFYHLYLRAQQEELAGNKRWASFHFNSRANKYLSEEALAELTKDMSAQDVKQEIDAEFIPGEGRVFTNILEAMYEPEDDVHNVHSGHPKSLTIDWGQKQDFTAISIGCKQCHKELKLIRWKGIDYPEQQRRIKALRDHWKPETIYAESNSMGLPNIQALQAGGVEVQAFDTTSQSKRQIIQGLKLALERGEWKFVNDPAGTLELEGYEASVSKTTGQVQYSAPSGMHDDSVIARALLVYSGNSGFGW